MTGKLLPQENEIYTPLRVNVYIFTLAWRAQTCSKQQRKECSQHAARMNYIQVSMSRSVNCTLHSSTTTEFGAALTHWLELFS